jgi:hypothetical protein
MRFSNTLFLAVRVFLMLCAFSAPLSNVARAQGIPPAEEALPGWTMDWVVPGAGVLLIDQGDRPPLELCVGVALAQRPGYQGQHGVVVGAIKNGVIPTAREAASDRSLSGRVKITGPEGYEQWKLARQARLAAGAVPDPAPAGDGAIPPAEEALPGWTMDWVVPGAGVLLIDQGDRPPLELCVGVALAQRPGYQGKYGVVVGAIKNGVIPTAREAASDLSLSGLVKITGLEGYEQWKLGRQSTHSAESQEQLDDRMKKESDRIQQGVNKALLGQQ